MTIATLQQGSTSSTRRRLLNGRRLLGALLALALLVLLVTPAAAVVPAQQAATQTEVDTWALTPCGPDPSQPSPRPNFAYTLDPGATQADCLQVWNYGNAQLTFHVYAADALNNSSGAFDLIAENAKSKDTGSWVSIAQNYVTLPAASSIRLPITITVPANVTPGDHSADIVAASQTPAKDAGGNQVLLNRRVGSRVYIRVNGPVSPALVTENLSSVYHPALNPLDGSMDVTWTLRNNGNVRLGAHQSVELHDLFGTVSKKHVADLPELLPGNAVTFTQHFNTVAATFRVSADVAVKPFVPKQSGVAVPDKLKATTTTTTAWAIPWLLIAVLVVLLVIIYLVRRKRRNADGDVAPDDGGPTGYAPYDGPPSPAEAPLGVSSTIQPPDLMGLP